MTSTTATAVSVPHCSDRESKPAWWRWAIALTAILAAVMEIIDTSIVNVALPYMQASLGATVSEIGWTITSYAMANVIMIPLSAKLGSVFGKKTYFIFCLIGFTVASVMCGMANSLPILIAARLLQGLMGGGLLAKAQAVLYETFPDQKEQALAQAIFGIGVMVGPAIGPVLGGYLTDNLGWPWIFYINIPLGILATLCGVFFFEPDRREERRAKEYVDWLGIIFLIIGLGCLQVFLEEGHRNEWFQSPFILWMAILAVCGLILFTWQELTVADPAVDLRVLRHRSLAAGSAFSVVFGMVIYGSVFIIPIYAQALLNFNATLTGLLLLPNAIASALFMLPSTHLAQKLDARLVVLAGALVMGFSLLLLSTLNPGTSGDSFLIPNILRGIGLSLMYMPLNLAALGSVPIKEIHAATGFFNLTRQIGGSIGIAAITTMLERRETFHHSILVEHISAFEPMTRHQVAAYTQMFAPSGPGMDRDQALTLLSNQLNIQAAMMAYSDVFWLIALTVIISCIFIVFLSNGKTDPSVKLSMH